MTARNDSARRDIDGDPAAQEPTAVLPETTAELVQVEQLQQQLAQAEERARNHWDQYLRAVADLENLRKRAYRDVESATRAGLERLAQELLPVMDSLSLAVASAGSADAASLAEGQEATLRLLQKAFENLGVRKIDPEGEPFDPRRHEAVLAQESANAEPDSVLRVVQPGYELDGRLLRPARVIVSKAPGA
jgi:molecular chaperone GrpE